MLEQRKQQVLGLDSRVLQLLGSLLAASALPESAP